METKSGILAYGTYVPRWRLNRSSIADALGGKSATGTRSVAGYDEDTTSMGVEAARTALASADLTPTTVVFATSAPAYQDKTNATAISAALGLGEDVLAVDMVGAVRSGTGAVLRALKGTDPTLVILSDVRVGRPSSADERDGGDAAAAMAIGPESAGPLVAEYLGGASTTAEFLDRWRSPGDSSSQVWEERFGEQQYVALALRAYERALADAQVTSDEVYRIIVSGVHPRAARSFITKAKIDRQRVVDDLASTVGNTGTAHAGLLLASVLDAAPADQVVVVLSMSDGVDAFVLRTTEHLASRRPGLGVVPQLTAGSLTVDYARYLTWRGHLHLEPPRRPRPDRPAGPPSMQRVEWKFGFVGSRCTCGQAHLPPQRVCVSCGAVDAMTAEKFSERRATVATHTVDYLAYSMAPPLMAAVLDFDGGGRYTTELTDCQPSEVAVGTRVEMTFRRLYTEGDVHNYFWKARPVPESCATEETA